MSELLRFAEHSLQEVALILMGLVYVTRLFWLFRWKAGGERQPSTAKAEPSVARRRGILYSWAVVGMPWALESFRTKLFLYSQFVVFHVGVTASILLSFVIPYGPELLEEYPFLVTLFQVFAGAAFLVGLYRITRRLARPLMRAISSPDDHFSLWLLTVWFFVAFLAAPNRSDGGEWHLLAYFFLTAFFLIYVPFSKISHYLYYPFTRYWFGRTMGYRGVYPLRRAPRPGGA